MKSSHSEPDQNSRLGLWLRWVKTRADMLDPLRRGNLPWFTDKFDEVMFPSQNDAEC